LSNALPNKKRIFICLVFFFTFLSLPPAKKIKNKKKREMKRARQEFGGAASTDALQPHPVRSTVVIPSATAAAASSKKNSEDQDMLHMHTCDLVQPFEWIPEDVLLSFNTTIEKQVSGEEPFLLSTKNLGLLCTHMEDNDLSKAADWKYYVLYQKKNETTKLYRWSVGSKALIKIFKNHILKYIKERGDEMAAGMILSLATAYNHYPVIPIGMQTNTSLDIPYVSENLDCNHPMALPSMPIDESRDIIFQICKEYHIEGITKSDERTRLCHILKDVLHPPLKPLDTTVISAVGTNPNTSLSSSAAHPRRKSGGATYVADSAASAASAASEKSLGGSMISVKNSLLKKKK